MSLSVIPTLRIYARHIRPHAHIFVALLLFLLAAYVLEGLVPVLLKRFIDVITESGLQGEALRSTAMTALYWVTGVGLIRVLLYRAGGLLNNYFQPTVMASLQDTAFSYILDHSYRFFSNSFAGSLTRRVGRFSRSFEAFADVVYWEFLQIGVSIVMAMVVFYTRNPVFTFVLGAWIIVFVALNYVISKWKLQYDAQRAEIDSELSGTIADAFSNSLTIKEFTGTQHERSIFNNVNTRFRKIQTFTWTLTEINIGLQVILMIILEFVCLRIALTYYTQGQLTIGDFVLIQTGLTVVFGHLWGFGRSMRNLYEAFADAKETVDILSEPHEVQDKPDAKELVVTRGVISCKEVSFGYAAGRPIVRDMSFVTRSQEKVAFVGSSGAGKSTIVKLLLRFFDLSGGSIEIDGQNIADVTQDSLRRAISVVPQDPILFHRSLMENIRYGRRDATDAEVIAASKKAHCHEFISKLPDGYDTLVGERGVKLSGGERQRVAIARAILKNAPILVLDEATSSLDSESEALIQDALSKLMKDKTVIVIAHRLSTIMQMDRILVIDGGRIIDEGTHQDLFQREGQYQRLWSIQAGGFAGSAE